MKSRILLSLGALIILLIINILYTPNSINPFQHSNIDHQILWTYRLPKAFTALFAGISLSISGFILQQLFRNYLAGPYILGVSSGASLAVAVLIIGAHYFPVLQSGIGISLAGFSGAMLVLLLVLSVSRKFGTGAIILLFGVILGQITGAFQNLLNYLALPGDLKYFTLWSMGSFSHVIEWNLIVFISSTLLGFAWAFTLMPKLSVMVLGNDVATTLGVNTQRTALQLMLCTGILSGIATAYCGPIAFVGMAIPNASRLLIKTSNFRTLLLVNACLGGGLTLLSDTISSIQIFQIHIPINVSMAILAGPFILYILLKKRK
jgi:iron complex transport system permease protein